MQLGVDGGRRGLGVGASVLAVLHAALLLLALPILALMILSTAWEGGDAALDSRLQSWGMLLGVLNLVAAALLIAGGVQLKGSPAVARRLLQVSSAVLVAMAASWAWVFRGTLVDPLMLGAWALLTIPGLVAALLAHAERSGAP